MKNAMIATLLALALASGAAHAQQKGVLESTLEQHRVGKAADGREALETAASVKPGDVIEYVAAYHNTGRAPVTGVQATVPVPPNTEFVPGSARPADAQASLDGTHYSAMPLVRKVVRDGKTIEEQVPVREYRYLRWKVPQIAGDQTVRLTARVRVLEDTSPPNAGKGGGK